MNNNFFIEQLDFDLDAAIVPTDVKLLAQSVGVDSVYCSGEYPSVFFKEISDFSQKNLRLIAEIQRKIWNNSSVVLLYVVSLTEIRIYNCNSTPVFFNTANPDTEAELGKRQIEYCKVNEIEKLNFLKSVFSSVAIDTGKLWTSEYSQQIKLKTKVDRYLVDSLLRLARILRADLDDETIHSLLIRSIFLMYLQDRKAIPEEIWNKMGVKDFLQALDDKEKTYSLFDEIANHFHGNILPFNKSELQKVTKEHLGLIKMCLIDGNIDLIQGRLFNWRLFDFSFIRIELLSEIYENFLNEFDPIRKKQTGTYYTPSSVVELVLDNVLPKDGDDYHLKIMDFACGSGIFLAQAYKRIVRYWVKQNSDKKLSFNALSNLMINSIFGVELDTKSIKVAAFSLYLALLDFLEPRDIWLKNGEVFPLLINDLNCITSNTYGSNLFRADSINENNEFEKIKYDVIVGNPPFGVNNLPKNIREYCEKYAFDKQFAIPFIHKSVQLAPNGKIALLFNTKLLTNKKNTAKNFRNWLFNENYVEKIYNLSILRKAPENFGGQLFYSASVPVSIICFRKNIPQNSSATIIYCAPKSFIKSNIAEGILIDSSDIKYIPREICNEPDINIWKISQWGTIGDYFLIKKLTQFSPLGESFADSNNGVGFQTLDKTTKTPIKNNQIKKLSYIQPEQINRYFTQRSSIRPINSCIKTQETKIKYLKFYNSKDIDSIPLINVFRRVGKVNAFYAPHIIIKEGLFNKRVCASYLDIDCSFNSKVYGIHHHNTTLLKALTCYINSKLSTYFLFLTSASWGIEREEIKPNDIKSLPKISEKYHKVLSKLLDDIIEKQNKILPDYLEDIEHQIDSIIYESLNLTEKEIILIEDLYKYSLSLFFEGEKSLSLSPISIESPETINYINIVCNELNEFLSADDSIVNGKIFKILPNIPLCVCILKFDNEKKDLELLSSDSELSSILNKINEFTLQEYSQNIYVRKQIRYYDNDRIYIIKPNQKRYWTRSQGFEDAESLLTEISQIKC
jgi:type I restriction-modification system DNA methylase subunit